MTPTENLSIVLGVVSIAVTIVLGSFAVWQAREYAREARRSGDRTADLQNQLKSDLQVLQHTTQLLTSLLGAQIDRLTVSIVQSPQMITETLKVFAASTGSARTLLLSGSDEPEARIKQLVLVARYSGSMNIFVRGLIDQLVDAGVWKTDNAFTPVFKDSYDGFVSSLHQLDQFSPDAIERAGATGMLKAFHNNYAPNVHPQHLRSGSQAGP